MASDSALKCEPAFIAFFAPAAFFRNAFLQCIEYRNYGSIKQSLDIKRADYDHFHRKDCSKLFVNSTVYCLEDATARFSVLLKHYYETLIKLSEISYLGMISTYVAMNFIRMFDFSFVATARDK